MWNLNAPFSCRIQLPRLLLSREFSSYSPAEAGVSRQHLFKAQEHVKAVTHVLYILRSTDL